MTRSYTLRDVERSHRESPRTFSIPRGEVRRGLQPGWLVKLVFDLPESVDGCGAERMWVVVVEGSDGRFVGRLDNQPKFLEQLAAGDSVAFEARHVAGVETGDQRRLAPIVGIGLDVMRHGQWPAWVAKVAATGDADDGWRVFSEREACDGATLRALSTSTLFRSWAVTDSAIDVASDGVWHWDEAALEYQRVESLPEPLRAAASGSLGRLHRRIADPDLRAVITRRALEMPPLVAQQLGPSASQADDSGWAICVGDETGAHLDDHRNSTVVPVGLVLHRYPYFDRVLGETAIATWEWDETLGDWRPVED